jgi:hypothetical protein
MIPIDRKEIEPISAKDSNGEQKSKIKKEGNIITNNNQEILTDEVSNDKPMVDKNIKLKTDISQNDEYVVY